MRLHFDWLIDWILTKAHVKNTAGGLKVEKHDPEGKDVLRTLHTKRKR